MTSQPSICIYTNEIPHSIVYSGKVKKEYLSDIEKIINSDNWKNLDPPILRIEFNDNTHFFCRTIDKYIYVIVCDNIQSSKVNELIEEINKFVISHSIKNFNHYTGTFNEIIKKFCQKENSIKKIQNQIDDLTGVMQQNIEIALDRHGKIKDLQDKTEILNNSASQFEKSSEKLKWHMKCKNIKLAILFGFGILVILAIFIVILTV